MNNKKKNILLILGFLMSLILCYQLAFSNTLALKKQLNTLKKQEAIFNNIPQQLSLLKKREQYYDSILNKYQIRESSLQNNLLKTLNQFAESDELIVTNFLKPHRIQQQDLLSTTYQFTVEGNYNSILKLIHSLEQQTKFGEIINLHFEKKKNYRKNISYLQAEVLIRNFREK